MYKAITKNEFNSITDTRYLRMTQDLVAQSCNGKVTLIDKNNFENKRNLFRFFYTYTKRGIIFTDFEPVFQMSDIREYEKFLILALNNIIDVAEEFSLPQLFVQSNDPRILEGYYETRFDKIRISSFRDLNDTYIAIKNCKKKE